MGYSANGSIRTTGTVAGDGAGQITKIKAGTGIQLESAGTIVSIIASGGGGGGSGNTLDDAYDQGGSGAGRTITADSGSVKINGTSNPLLNLDPSATSAISLRIDSSAYPSLLVDSEDNGDVIRIAGPIQTQYQTLATGGSEKIGDSTAMDLSVGGESEYHTPQGAASAILGGVRNAIASETDRSVPESVDSVDSTRAQAAVIVGGADNQIFSQLSSKAAKYSAIIGGRANEVKYDSSLETASDVAASPESSVIAGGASNDIINADACFVAGGGINVIQSSLGSAVIAGESNVIDVPNSGTLSADTPRNNVIIGGESNAIQPTLVNPYNSADISTHLGQNNVILGGRGNEVFNEAKNCVLLGDSAAAGTDSGGVDNDNSVLFIGGRFDAPAPGGDQSTDNAFMFPGISSRHSGTSDAGKGYADASFNGGGADYAEMFEWNDGNPNDQDRVGFFVKISSDGTLPNGKIEVGGDGMIVGPVSSMPGMVVNNPGMRWNSKYIVDDFGRFVLNADGNRQLNPNYDSTLDYRGRTGRKEWTPIALKGRVRVRASTNIGIYPSNKSGLTVNVNADGTVSDAGSKGKYKVLQVVKQKEIWSGPQGLFRSRDLVQDHGYGVVEILVE